jgi:DNA-directed RNA polymerase specialized sigma24 family protein
MTQDTHTYEELPRSSKLSPEDVNALLSLTSRRDLSLRDIGVQFDVSHETVRTILKKAGLNRSRNSWRQITREIQSQKNKIYQEIYDFIGPTLEQRLSQATWAERKTVEYFESLIYTTKASHKREDVLKLFQAYESAERDGIKLSLEQFQDITGIWYPSIGKIFQRVNVKPMYGNLTIRPINFFLAPDIEERLERFVDQEISPRDLSYFLNVPEHVVYRRLKKFGRTLRHYCDGFTYRLASEIYHAQDLKFNDDEIGELLGLSSEKVKKALRRRQELEPKITDMLKTLFDDYSIDTPYIQKV